MAIKQMTTQDIVRDCDQMRGHNDWKQVYVALHKSIESGKYRIMRCNNTLFWYRIDGEGSAQLFVFNADSDRRFMRNFKDFCKAMERSNFKNVYGITIHMNLIQLLKHSGYPTTVEDAGKDGNGNTQYKVTVNV